MKTASWKSLLLASALFAATAIASPGDWLDEFIDCKIVCESRNNCPTKEEPLEPYSNSFPQDHTAFAKVPFVYKTVFLWDCNDDCDYQCQQLVTRARIEKEEEIYQFHGKWPFIRMFGMQEFFSAIFSIGNLIPHYRGFRMLEKELWKTSIRNSRYKRILQNYQIVSIMGMCAWLSSTVFHTRDLVTTEKFDYFFAGATVCTAFYAIVMRLLISEYAKYGNQISKIGGVVVSAIFACHILRLYIDWSYTYNMRFNIFFGVLQYVILISLAVKNYFQYGLSWKNFQTDKDFQKVVLVPVLLVLSTCAGMSFEIFDIFIYKLQIDSHALWHLATILPSFWLYSFFIEDYYKMVQHKSKIM